MFFNEPAYVTGGKALADLMYLQNTHAIKSGVAKEAQDDALSNGGISADRQIPPQ